MLGHSQTKMVDTTVNKVWLHSMNYRHAHVPFWTSLLPHFPLGSKKDIHLTLLYKVRTTDLTINLYSWVIECLHCYKTVCTGAGSGCLLISWGITTLLFWRTWGMCASWKPSYTHHLKCERSFSSSGQELDRHGLFHLVHASWKPFALTTEKLFP